MDPLRMTTLIEDNYPKLRRHTSANYHHLVKNVIGGAFLTLFGEYETKKVKKLTV